MESGHVRKTTYFGSFGNIKRNLPHPSSFVYVIDPKTVTNTLYDVRLSWDAWCIVWRSISWRRFTVTYVFVEVYLEQDEMAVSEDFTTSESLSYKAWHLSGLFPESRCPGYQSIKKIFLCLCVFHWDTLTLNRVRNLLITTQPPTHSQM